MDFYFGYISPQRQTELKEKYVVGTEGADSKGQPWVEWKAETKYRKRERK